MFQRENLWTSLDKNDRMGHDNSDMRLSEGIVGMCLNKNATLSMFLNIAMYTMNRARRLQDKFLNKFLDRNVTVKRKRSIIRFQRRSTTVYSGSNVLI